MAFLPPATYHATGFIQRTYDWLGPVTKLGQVQRLMLERVLLPFEYFTKRRDDPLPRDSWDVLLHGAVTDEGPLVFDAARLSSGGSA